VTLQPAQVKKLKLSLKVKPKGENSMLVNQSNYSSIFNNGDQLNDSKSTKINAYRTEHHIDDEMESGSA